MKKLLALVLSFAMILTMVQLPLVISAEDVTENVVTVYVSTLGSDDGTGTAESPFATISKAMAVIEADTTATAGKIIISEDDNGVDADGAEIADGITFTAAAHTKMITVCGIDGSIVINGVNRDTYHEIKGPTTFENITLKTFSIFPKGNKLVLGSGITSSGAGTIAFGFTGSVDGEDVYISNLARDGYYAWRSIFIGNATKYVANGDVNVYIESIHTNQVQLRSGTFNGNVNVTINGFGGISGHSKFGVLTSHTPVFNGAVQVLWNNGITRSEIDSESLRSKAPADRTWIMYGDKAEDGSILEMTDTVGKYQVKGGMVANAYKIDVTSTTADDGSVTYTETVSDTPIKSKGGILDVSDAPGEYKVEYIKPVAEENEDLVVYVDAENGKDTNDGKTIETAFATIDHAQNWLNASIAEGEKIIYIKGLVDFDGGEPHSEMMTLKGYDATAELNYITTSFAISSTSLSAAVLQGPTTFDGLKTEAQSATLGYAYFVSGAHKFVVKNGKDTGWLSHNYYLGPVASTSTDKRTVVILEDAGGTYGTTHSYHFGAMNNTNKTSAGVDFLMKAGKLYSYRLIKGTTFTGDVNLVIDNCSARGDYSYIDFINEGSTLNAAAHIVFNNGMYSLNSADSIANLTALSAAKGAWIIDSQKAADGSVLRTTTTAGKFTVEGGMIAKAFKVTDGVAAETASYTSKNGILDISDEAGVYTVKYFTPEAEVNDDTIIYVSETGSDLNDGQTPESAFGSIEFAEKWLNASTAEGDKTIEIIGTVQFYSNVEHEDMFIYKAHDSSAVLGRNSNYYNKPDLYGVVILKGPATFEGFSFTNADPKVHTNGHKFVYKSDSNTMAAYVGNYGKDNNNNRENFIYNSAWDYWDNMTIVIGSPTVTATTVNGADVNLISGELNKIEFGMNNTYTDDVNVVFNGIRKRGDGYGGLFDVGSNIVFEKALQFVFNKGQKSWLKNDSEIAELEGMKANGGTWILYGETASDGSVLKTTETAGKFAIEGNLVANAYKVVDGVEATVPVQSIDGILDLTDAEGIYNVKYSTRTAIENNDSVVYVSETGSDLSNGKTAETAFGTLEFALNWMAKSTAADKEIVIVSGAEYVFTPVAYDGMLTVTSVDGNTTLKFSDTVLLSNVTFDDVILSGRIYSNGNKVVITKLCSLADSSSGIVAGANTADNKKQDEIIINAGGPNSWSGMFRVGATKTIASNGLKVTFNGGNFNQFVFSDWAKDGVHNGDVNFVFNSGIGGYAGNSGMTDNSNGTQVFNGALQFVLNNNVKRTTLAEGVWAMTAKDGVWFMCVTAGGTLDTTADEGVFKVTSDLTAKAVNVKTGETYFSIGGYLTVPAGEYDVGFISDENLTKNIYVSQNGSDDNNGLSEATAVKTISKALEISSKTANIIVVDTAVYDITSAYENDITIKGGKITGDVTLYGDLIIESTVIDTETIDTNGYALIIGEDVSFANGNPYVVSDKRIIINSGEYANIRIEGNDISKLYAYGSTVEEVVIATSSTEAIVKVNLEGATNFTFDNAEYKSVLIIANKATVDVEAEDAWIVGSEESGNSSVDFADVEGKFTVTTEINKIAVAVANGGETVYLADAFDNTYDEIDLDATAATTHNDFINYRGGMPNVYKKLLNNEKLNVVYFGGSVTAGAGLPTNADREIDSWRAKIGAWLTNNFPNSNIKNISKAAGESGTYLGSYRIPYLIAEDPDLLIIEYSINDYYYHSTYEDAAARFETIVREIKTALPDCDIITVLVTEKAFYTPSSNGELHEQARAHDDVAKYYNIPSIKVGCALTSQIAYADWNTYFSDIVHPTAAGYQLYYNCIEEFFANALFHADYDDDYRFVMPPVKSTYLFDGGRTVQNITPELVAESETMGGSGYTWFERDDGETNGGIMPSTSGTDTFYFKFYGTEVALSFSHVGEQYFPLISIDGGEDFVPAVRNLAHNPIVLAMDLEPGWHTVKITSACTTLANKIQAIYYADASQHTLQGEGADETLKNATLTLDKGTYNVKYLTTFDELVAPEKEGYEFIGWKDDEGNIVTEFVAGAKLTAAYEEIGLPEEDKPFDVSGDGVIDGTDLVEVMKKILLNFVDEMFDVNNDGYSDIRDLVALKNKLASLEK